jgi:hypothetical protein
MTWLQTVVSVTSALTGGFVGGWVVAFRMGRWRQRMEDHVESIEKRLNSGDRALENVPVIETRLDVLLTEIRSLKEEMREDRRCFVTHEECNRRHGTGGPVPR